MRITIRFSMLLAISTLLLLCCSLAAGDQPAELSKFFREYIGLTDDQMASIQSGKAIAKVLDSESPDNVFVFGAVYVDSTPEQYLKFASDIDRLRKLPNYLAIRKFSSPPQLTDLDGFALSTDDIKELKDCEAGRCKVQLPTEAMDAFKQMVDWSGPDVESQVNRLAQSMALEALLRYKQGGNPALGTYRDKKHSTAVSEAFQALLNRSRALPVYLPELDRYLLDYPNANSGNIEAQFYWENVNFGLKPTLRIVQAIVFRGTNSAGPAYAIAVKQIYASHYFETALDLTVCVPSESQPEHGGFYLVTLKGSRQAGLTGLKGNIVRKVAVDKTRSSLERALQAIKRNLEANPRESPQE
ncbi:MAG: hypothetical protein WA817_02765 [Candidatus Acidiferrum sp.]